MSHRQKKISKKKIQTKTPKKPLSQSQSLRSHPPSRGTRKATKKSPQVAPYLGFQRHQKSPPTGQKPYALPSLIAMARGESPCDLVIKNGRWLDVFQGVWHEGDIAVAGGLIVGVGESYTGREVVDAQGLFLVPGFIDAHVHIESSLMTPERFSQAVLPRGTTTAIWDPHEIANVWGVKGIQWALEESEGLDLCIFVMVPSCVPSTSLSMGLEQSGAHLTADDLKPFRNHPRVLGLAEMMNFPGLLHGDEDVMAKLEDFRGMLRDGHCPGLSGKDLNAYGVAGIHSCHESTTLPEAHEKLSKGIHVLIREGSCAKNAGTLLPLLNDHTSSVLGYCSDDRNPLDIDQEGHIDRIINLALKAGHPAEQVFRAASFGPARMYRLYDRGALAPGYWADMVAVRPARYLSSGKDKQKYFSSKDADLWKEGIHTELVFKKGVLQTSNRADAQNPKAEEKSSAHTQRGLSRFSSKSTGHKSPQGPNLKVQQKFLKQGLGHYLKLSPQNTPKETAPKNVRVIGVIPQQIITRSLVLPAKVSWENHILHDLEKDVLKICVVERHHRTGAYGLGLVHGFGLKSGAIATSINHDSHNIIIVGSSDETMEKAFDHLMEIDGGIVVVSESGEVQSLPLPFGGLMSPESPLFIAQKLRDLKALAHGCGCVLEEPFLQLSFLALPVIGELKITDQGLVDVSSMSVVSVVC